MGQLSGRSIRTFVLRQGRLTEGQQRSLDDHWGEFGIDVNNSDLIPTVCDPVVQRTESEIENRSASADQRPVRDASLEVEPIDLDYHFENKASVWMEIGIGNGDALTRMAGQNAQVNFLGVEVHLPGVGHALGEIAAAQLSNVRLIRYDVLDLVEFYLKPASLDRVLIYFPDPWHKTRHHKRRLVSARFLDSIAPLLREGGMIHFATDWVPYAVQVREIVSEHKQFECLSEGEEALAVTRLRPETHFERRGLKLGHVVTDLVLKKITA